MSEKNSAFENRPTKSWNLKNGEEKRFREKKKVSGLSTQNAKRISLG